MIVNLSFKTVSDREKFFEIWKPLAEHVAEYEPDCLAYEASISDKNGKLSDDYSNHKLAYISLTTNGFPPVTGVNVVIYERQGTEPPALSEAEIMLSSGYVFGVMPYLHCRYVNKEIAFLQVHQRSAPFKKFQERMAAEVDVLSKTGESYVESDVGFA